MNFEIKQKWLTALRSGDYKQGKNFLKKDGEYCCLGVLCDLAEKEKVCIATKEELYTSSEIISFDLDSKTLPYSVKNWAGLGHYNPFVEHKGYSRNLANLNDVEGLNFEEIADLIEKDL